PGVGTRTRSAGMARIAGDAVPVMENATESVARLEDNRPVKTGAKGAARATAARATATTTAAAAGAAAVVAVGRHAGPYGASFDGTEEDGTTAARGLNFPRRWTRPGVHPYDEIDWETRTASIGNESGKTVFEQKDVEVPKFWSQLATNV